MYTREQFIALEPALTERPLESVEELYVEDVRLEAAAILHRQHKLMFHQGSMHFWVNSVRVAEKQHGPQVGFSSESPLCRPLSEQEFQQVLTRSLCSEGHSIKIHPRGAFVEAHLMFEDWYEVGAVAEFEKEYISIIWSTSA
jgi:hypothetical protein